ncbi:MAG: hypothetical protein IME96_06925 [Proteobacteria bacterium]|nr:hypothetical protein [Pseudomonadota bacterium]
MDITLVLKLLEDQIGLNAQSIGISTVEKHIHKCMSECGSSSVYDYLKRLNNDPSELRKLTEAVVIPETFFFRDRTPFTALGQYVRQFRTNIEPTSPLRILSAPCSTGEEPYSIAMLLFDMGLNSDQFQIDAVDISDQFIKSAKSGLFRAYSFRGKDLDFRERHFSKEGEEYRLKDKVHGAVNFQQGNLLAHDFVSDRDCYDVIFCRNLLIYFDESAKKKAIAALSQLLCSDGVLFVGHAETASLSTHRFDQLDYPMAFSFAKIKEAKRINALLNISTPIQRERSKIQIQTDPEKKQTVPGKTPPLTKIESLTAKPPLMKRRDESNEKQPSHAEAKIAEAIRLADEGAFKETVALCEELIKEDAVSAQVYFILGKAVDSMGDAYQADEYLRKAVYLDPTFYEALTYLATLSERMGDLNKAEGFRTRAERVKRREDKKAGS